MTTAAPTLIQPSAVYTAAEAAVPLRCSAKTVEQLLRDGDLAGIKPGGEWIIPGTALLRRLDELAIEQAAERRKPKPAEPASISTGTAPAKRTAGRQARALPKLVDLRAARQAKDLAP
jgi:excisionase family DNA binding protein